MQGGYALEGHQNFVGLLLSPSTDFCWVRRDPSDPNHGSGPLIRRYFQIAVCYEGRTRLITGILLSGCARHGMRNVGYPISNGISTSRSMPGTQQDTDARSRGHHPTATARNPEMAPAIVDLFTDFDPG